MEIDGRAIRVEMATSKKTSNETPPNYDLRVRIQDLSPRTTWQDLKDWARNAGTVKYANVFTRGSKTLGVIEFTVSLSLLTAKVI